MIQTFLRTLWTPLKFYYQTKDIENGLCPGCADHWPCNTAHLLYECTGLASNVWNFIHSILIDATGRTERLTKFQVLYLHRVQSLTEVTIIVAGNRAIMRTASKVAPPIHPKVAMACLKKELLEVAHTNMKALRDHTTWMKISRLTREKWQEMVENRLYVTQSV